jgi:anti-sigma factor RsiW
MSAAELSCKELVEVITDYLEGAMPDADRARFEAHLDDCPWCRNYLEQMRHTVATLGELPEESIDPAIREDLLEAFRDWRRAAGG